MATMDDILGNGGGTPPLKGSKEWQEPQLLVVPSISVYPLPGMIRKERLAAVRAIP